MGARHKLVLLLCVIFASPAVAERRGTNHLKPWSWLVLLQGDMIFNSPAVDQIPSAVYETKYRNSLALNLGAGYVVGDFLYVGVRYQHWIANQKYTLGAQSFTNKLNYRALAADIGWITGNPRVFWILGGSVFYPLKLEVEDSESSTLTTNPGTRIHYEGRLTLGLRITSPLLFTLSGGYRFANFFPTEVGDSNFSGIFGSVGLGLTF